LHDLQQCDLSLGPAQAANLKINFTNALFDSDSWNSGSSMQVNSPATAFADVQVQNNSCDARTNMTSWRATTGFSFVNDGTC
jgi:hypothetical protein